MENSDKLKPLPGAVPRRRVWVLGAWLVILIWQFPLLKFGIGQAQHAARRWWRGGPGPSPAASPKPEPRLRTEFWHAVHNQASPRLQAFSYKEGVIHGLRHLRGLLVWRYDYDDTRSSCVLTVQPSAGATPIMAELTVDIEASGRAVFRFQGPKGTADLRTMQPYAKDNPLASGAAQALDDLPRIVTLLGLEDRPLPKLHTGQVQAFNFDTLKSLEESLSAARDAPSTASPVQLARVARALAWTSLLDHRLAPTLAVRRAAESLAFASIAEQLAGSPLPEAAAARWLAVGAAAGDFFLLTRTPPPKGFPELDLLHHAYDSADPLVELPAGLEVPAVVASCARAEAVNEFDVTAALVNKLRGLSGILPSYLAQFGEFSTVAMVHGSALDLVVRDFAATQVNAHTGKITPAELNALNSGTRQSIDAALKLARRLLNLRKRGGYVSACILEEGAERLLRAIDVKIAAARQYGWKSELADIGAALREHASWKHPQVQWMLAASDLGDPPVKPEATQAAMNAFAIYPGLPGHAPTRLRGQPMLGYAQTAISMFPDHPGNTYRKLRDLLGHGSDGQAMGLLEALQRTEGKTALPFFQSASFLPDAVRDHLLTPHAPAHLAARPSVAMVRADALGQSGDLAGARDLLERAQARFPGNQALCDKLWKTCLDLDDLDGAQAALKRFVETQPPGLARYQSGISFARQLLDESPRYDALALEMSKQAASCAAAWAYDGHALVCAVVGKEADALAALTASENHYGKAPYHELLRAEVAVLASKGARGWDVLEKAYASKRIEELPLFATALRRAGIAVPATELGRRLTLEMVRRPLMKKWRSGSLTAADVAQVDTLCDATGPLAKDLKTDLAWVYYGHFDSDLKAQAGGANPMRAPAALKSFADRSGELDLALATYVLQSLLRAGGTEIQLTKAATLFAGLVPARDRSILEALMRDPGGLRRWIMVASPNAARASAVTRYIEYLWLTGRDAALRDLCDALVKLEPFDIGWGLHQATGSSAAARAYLTKHGVPASSFKAWGAERGEYPVQRSLLAHFRPDGSDRNPLADQ